MAWRRRQCRECVQLLLSHHDMLTMTYSAAIMDSHVTHINGISLLITSYIMHIPVFISPPYDWLPSKTATTRHDDASAERYIEDGIAIQYQHHRSTTTSPSMASALAVSKLPLPNTSERRASNPNSLDVV